MNDNSKILTRIVIGAAAGAAITMLLTTDTGKQLLADVKAIAIKSLKGWKNAVTESVEEAETAV